MPTTHQKILTPENLAFKVEKLRQEGKRIVLCHGTFDLLHIGHIRHLQSASKEGDVLITTITGDSYVNKGPGRPIFNEHLRSENLAALACVDFISINQASTAINVISKVKPQVYVKGKDYKKASDDVTGNITREKKEVEKYGGKVIFDEENLSEGIYSAQFKPIELGLPSGFYQIMLETAGVTKTGTWYYVNSCEELHPELVGFFIVGDCYKDL